MPKISVIIPVYNVEKYIRQALDSVVNQTLQDIEIICINDCTPDNSFEIVKEYVSKDSRFVLLEQETNQGQGVARNRALDIATGEYIMFLDPDDWFELDACEKAYNQISKNKNEIVFFNLYIQKEKKWGYKSSISKRINDFGLVLDNQHLKLADLDMIQLPAAWTWCQIYSRNFLNKNNIRYSNERFLEDLHFFIKAWINSKDVSILNEPLYNYRKTKTKTFDYASYFEHVLSSKEKAYLLICESENKIAFLKQFTPYRIKSDIHWLRTFSRSNKKIRKDFYNRIKTTFEKIQKEFSQEIIIEHNKYEDFLLITKCNSWEEYRLKRILRKILKIITFQLKKRNFINAAK